MMHLLFRSQISLESKLNGRQKVKGGNGSISASISTSIIASVIASIITLNLGVGCAPSCWQIFGFRNLLSARRGFFRLLFEILAAPMAWRWGRAGKPARVEDVK